MSKQIKPQSADKAPELPDEKDVDSWQIPYGEAVRTKHGIICSSRPAPDYRPYGQRPYKGLP